MKKYVGQREIRIKTIKKSSPQYESEKANKLNNKLMLYVDEQKDDIKHSLEHFKENAVCVTCKITFATTNGLKKCIQENISKKSSC